jgi:hypothetical protein
MNPHPLPDAGWYCPEDDKRCTLLGAAPLSRRQALRTGVLGAAGMFLTHHLATRSFAAPPRVASGARAKAFIQIWLWGGASHLETFDPKPEAGAEYTGPFTSPIETNVSGVRICELLPLLAKQADRYALIRSMTHGVNAHETAAYMVQTARPAGGRDVYPSLGAVVSLFKGYGAGYEGLLPPYVVLTELQGRFSEAGFLGPRYKPFATGGDPARTPFAVEGVIAPGITESRQQSRRELLGRLDTLARLLPRDPQISAMARDENAAYDLILGDAGKVFDLAREDEAMRERYGKNTFGQSCLMARRLVEKGVPFVTINYKGWDTHKTHFQIMRRKLPELDRGLSALLSDLGERGLLDSTIVWCSGEFGRTPKVMWEAPWNGGRGHHGRVFSSLVAGGGFRGGQVVGASDAHGEEVRDRPVYPADLMSSFYSLLGIDPLARLPHPEGREIAVSPAGDADIRQAGMLKEIMS